MPAISYNDVPLPLWEFFIPESEEYKSQKRDALDYARLNMSLKDLKDEAITFLADVLDVSLAKSLDDHTFITIGKYCWMLNNGAIFDEETKEFFNNLVSIIQGKIAAIPQTISQTFIYPVDDGFELFNKFEDFIILKTLDADCHIAYQLLVDEHPASKALISLSKHLKEQLNFMESLDDDDRSVAYPKFKEKYQQYLKLVQLVKIYKKNHQQNKKNERDRTPVGGITKRVTKQTEDVNFKAEDTDLQLVSVDPSSIMGKSTLLMYNTSTRNVSLLYATKDGFEIRGTTIHNIDDEKSFTKKIRNPKKQMRAFHNVSQQRAEIIMGDDYIKSKKQDASGRMNNETILMQVW